MDSSSYLAGKSQSKFPPPSQEVNKFYASQQCDGQNIEDCNIQHSALVNIGFKCSKISRVKFRFCTFINCYFRNAVIKDTSFVGCRFIDCNFRNCMIERCDFRYATFDRCAVSSKSLLKNLPSEHNLCAALTHNLALETERDGDWEESKIYRLRALKAKEDDLWEAFVNGSNPYYKRHYPTVIERAGALARYLIRRGNYHLWHYGESWATLLRNFLIFTLGLYPAFLYSIKDSFNSNGKAVTFWEIYLYGIMTILPSGYSGSITPTTIIATSIAIFGSLVGLVITGLFVSILFSAITRP